MPTSIFISVGRTFRPEQEEFVAELERFLQGQGLTPRAVGRNEWSADHPLQFIGKVMDECSGTVVIAFERLHVEKGTEKRGSADERDISGSTIPTVWNQIEAGMAHSRKHPLLVIVENSLRVEGLLERTQEWYVLRLPLKKQALADPEFLGVFGAWKKKVEDLDRTGGPLALVSPGDIKIGPLLKNLNVKQAWAFGGAAFSVIAAIAAAAFWAGKNLPVP